MFSLGIFLGRLVWFVFLSVSFWPWEWRPGEIKKTSLPIPSSSSLVKTLRVALFYEKSEVQVGIAGPYEVNGMPGNEPLTQGPFLGLTSIRWDPAGIRIGSTLYPVSGLRFSGDIREIQVGKRKYHNVVQILKNPAGSLTVINEIDVEDYLKGVLPWESNPDWPIEALKAQAVVSRTYAIFENIRNKDFPFALSSDVGSQVYAGKTIERASSNQAVEETRGEILTYKGKIFSTFFHSTCGGMTVAAHHQLKVEPHPALKGVECSFCIGSKHFYWKAEFGAPEIQKLLAKKGFSFPDIHSIVAEELDRSARPRFFIVHHAKDSSKVPANEFRLALGANRMRSTRVASIEKMDNSFVFHGRGWGHGVGMCQFGTKRLAELGYRYTDMLRYYYPGSELRNIEEFIGMPQETLTETRSATGPIRQRGILGRWFSSVKSYVEEVVEDFS